MRSLTIPTMPACFTAMASQRPNGPWFNGNVIAERSCRKESREFLLANQNNNCGWCQQKITIHSSHIDHILPQATNSHLTFTPSNLLASCGATTSTTCGHKKSDSILANWVNPYQTPDLEDFFTYEIDGAINPAPHIQAQAEVEALTAINHILNLNESVLKGQRELLISDLTDPQYIGLTVEQIYLAIGEFKSVIQQYAPAL
jgi:uncharacterized protein (TIGR02646 family)